MAQESNSAKSETFGVTFEPELVTRFWQHNAIRLMRANERILHGFVAAATRELELARALTRYNLDNLAKFNKLPNVAAPEKANKPNEEENFKEFEHIVAGLRAVTEELWTTFGDASKLLLEGTLTEAEDAVIESAKKGANQVKAAAERASESIKG